MTLILIIGTLMRFLVFSVENCCTSSSPREIQLIIEFTFGTLMGHWRYSPLRILPNDFFSFGIYITQNELVPRDNQNANKTNGLLIGECQKTGWVEEWLTRKNGRLLVKIASKLGKSTL